MLGSSWVAAQLAPSQDELSSMSEWTVLIFLLELGGSTFVITKPATGYDPGLSDLLPIHTTYFPAILMFWHMKYDIWHITANSNLVRLNFGTVWLISVWKRSFWCWTPRLLPLTKFIIHARFILFSLLSRFTHSFFLLFILPSSFLPCSNCIFSTDRYIRIEELFTHLFPQNYPLPIVGLFRPCIWFVLTWKLILRYITEVSCTHWIYAYNWT
jgi:hypothetical protein